MDIGPNPFPAHPAPQSGGVGPLAAAVVIVILLAVGGFYFFYNQQHTTTASQTGAVENSQATNTQPDSVGSMQTDLNATQTGGSESDLQGLNNSL